MERVYAFWYGNKNCINPRLKPIADRLLRDIPGAKIVGGYVRGLIHEDKVAHDIDVVVPDAKGLDVAYDQLTRNFGCKTDSFGITYDFSENTYHRFTCPRGVTVDVVTKKEFEKTRLSSSAHQAALTSQGLENIDAMYRNKQFICFTLGSVSCDKLDKEGWTRHGQ